MGLTATVWGTQLQCGARSYSVVHAATVYCMQLQCGALSYSVVHAATVYCMQLQCGAHSYSVVHAATVWCTQLQCIISLRFHCFTVYIIAFLIFTLKLLLHITVLCLCGKLSFLVFDKRCREKTTALPSLFYRPIIQLLFWTASFCQADCEKLL